MIEKLERGGSDFAVVVTKLNEVIDYLNGANYEQAREEVMKRLRLDEEKREYEKRESKWKVGDYYWYIDADNIGDLNIHQSVILYANTQRSFSNIFKTREQAEAALAEIKEVLRRYQ
jgi:hypothetical protein